MDEGFNADQRDWMDQIEKDIASCSSAESYEHQDFVIVVTFGGGPPIVAPPANFPPALGACVIPLLSKAPPASVKNGPIEVLIEVGK